MDVQDVINQETRAWSEKSTDLLLSVFHPDMVWVWPTDPKVVDPATWAMPNGRFDRTRWEETYRAWFDEYQLIKNDRVTRSIIMTPQGDGAFAVVDIDTLWRSKSGATSHWYGRTGKTYVKTSDGWKMIAQVGVFDPQTLKSNLLL